MGGSFKPALCIAKVIFFLINGKIYRTKKRPDKNFHQGVSIKINIIMKKIIFLYF
jgi:hypothetical protein